MAALNKEKLLKQLSKRQKRRREQRPAPMALEVKPASMGLQHTMVSHHEDLLQNIEFSVLQAYNQDDSGQIDDRAVMNGYRNAILGVAPDDPPAGRVVRSVAMARFMREGFPDIGPIDDGLWRDALRVLMRSVKTHSQFRPGETSYLDFIGHFIR